MKEKMSNRKRKVQDTDSKVVDAKVKDESVAPAAKKTTSARAPLAVGEVADDVFAHNVYMECGNKFYDISVLGNVTYTIWGTVGTYGTTLEMGSCSEKASMGTLEEKVKEKKRKGYVETVRPAPLAVPPVTYEVKLLKNDHPNNKFYDKCYNVTQCGKEVFIRDGFHSRRFTTTNKSFKGDDAARKFVDKSVADAIGKGYHIVE